MAIPQTTIIFQDHFQDIAGSLASYNDDSLINIDGGNAKILILPGEGPDGEGLARVYGSTYDCPNCTVSCPAECGQADGCCYLSLNLMKTGGIGTAAAGNWRHLRAWVRPHGDWSDGVPLGVGYCFAMGLVVHDPGGGCIVAFENFWPYYGVYINHDGSLDIVTPGSGVSLPAGTCPFDEWTVIEIAGMASEAHGYAGEAKAWINGINVLAETWASLASSCNPGGNIYNDYNNQLGFFVGNWTAALAGAGKYVDFARVAYADGPIGPFGHDPLPPEVNPVDPDAYYCTNDLYDTDCLLVGECGRWISRASSVLGRESWETSGAGFPAPQSCWAKWVAPRDGKFIWRTKGSTVFNEIGIYEHTGSFPPPQVGFSDVDDWDPDGGAGFSSAVEVTVRKGVEYRIRAGSSDIGWVNVEWSAARQLVQDDGWSVNADERTTLTREVALDVNSGFAIQDDQVALNPSGDGTQKTLGDYLLGTTADPVPAGVVSVVDPQGAYAICRSIVRVQGTGSSPGVWHVGLFVDGTQVHQQSFVNRTWVTYTGPLIQINRGSVVDVRVYRLVTEATDPAQISDWRLESLSTGACDSYQGGPLEGFYTSEAQITDAAREADQEARLRALEGVTDPTAAVSDFVDPGGWAPEQDVGSAVTPPWDASSTDPGSPTEYQFQPFPPA